MPVAYAVREGKPTDVKIQKGGQPGDLGELVRRGVPTCLDPSATLAIPAGSSGRLELARWLTSGPAQALTARVMVNRIWQHHFGKPIVPTPSDFGLRGTPPDASRAARLAGRRVHGLGLVDQGDAPADHALEDLPARRRTVDPANAEKRHRATPGTGGPTAARSTPRPCRDTLLDLAGRLDRSRPGPHPFPPPETWTFTAHHQFKAVYPSDHRSVYLMVQRLQPHPYLALFNGPDASLSTAVRDGASMPLQSLFLLNSPFVHEQSGRFARSLCRRESHAPDRLRLAYLQAFARTPTETEAARALAFLARYERSLEAEGVAPDRRELEAWSSLARTLLASNEFIYVE